LGMVHACDHPRNRELLLGEERDDEVVLVVPGRCDHDVVRLEPRFFQRRHLARVGDSHLEAGPGMDLGRDLGDLLQDEDVVAVVEELLGDEGAHVSRAGEGDSHQCVPVSSGPTSRLWSSSRASTWTAKWSTSRSCPTSSPSMTCAWASRVSETSWNRPGSLSPLSFRPAHAAGRSRSTRHTSPLAPLP